MGKFIKKASELGFCPGVRRAIEATKNTTQSGQVFTLGKLVHNDAVVKGLEPPDAITYDMNGDQHA